MTLRTGRERSTAEGFTLVELLVAMTVLGLLAGLMFGGFRFGVRAWERAESHVDQAGEIQIVQAFLRSRLSEAAPVWVPGDDQRGVLLFEGSDTHLTFVTVMPVHLETGGYSIIELDHRRRAEGGELLLRWRPFRFGAEEETEQEADQRVLLSQVQDVDFAYFGRLDEEDRLPAWFERWEGSTRLPELVRLRLEFAAESNLRWPELVVAPVVTSSSQRRR